MDQMDQPLLNDVLQDSALESGNDPKKKTMSCRCCTPTCRKWTVFGFSVFFLILGIVLVFFTDDIVQAVKNQELNLGSSDTTEYKMWEVTPIPMYIDFYLFNWTNAKEVVDSKWTIKPKFSQLGPFSYHEKHYRKKVVFNSNRTLTYQTQRIWHFAPEKSNGSLYDEITVFNPVLAVIGNIVKFKHAIVKMGVNFFLEEKRVNLTVTKTIKEFIFDGYDDPMVDLLKKVHLRHLNLPFDKFGWFAARNGSIVYDGTYNMYDGTDDIRKLGRFARWNYQPRIPYYADHCGEVSGTSGELWYPVQDDSRIEIFSPDTCSTLTLVANGTEEMYGVTGHKFVADDSVFDNGTKYPEMGCFSPGEVLPAGIRNVSECKFGAPAFVSLPHFNLADPYYREAIDGMEPDPSEHTISVAIEPETGIPLEAKVAAQLSLRVESIEKLKVLEGVKTHVFPFLWFKQYATLDQALASQAKLLIDLPSIGQYTGYGVIGLGCIVLAIFAFVTWKKLWGGREEENLINQEGS